MTTLTRINETEQSLNSTKAKQNSTDNKETELKIKNASDLLTNMKSLSASYVPSSIITGLSNNKGKGISLSGFEIVSTGDNLIIVIDGKALTRESLVAFKNKLVNMSGVTKVELPITALAQSKDINFHIKIESDPKVFKPTLEVGENAKPALLVEIPASTTTVKSTNLNTSKVQTNKPSPKSLLVQ